MSLLAQWSSALLVALAPSSKAAKPLHLLQAEGAARKSTMIFEEWWPETEIRR
jgi:hypothetical protein